MNRSPATADPPPVLQLQQLSVWYRDQLAIRDVSLEIPSGKITALVGPSGCGKTSLLHAINRMTDLIPGARVTGEIRLHGVNVLERDTDLIQLRRRVGLIFQRPNPFPLSIYRNLELPLRESGSRDRQLREAKIEAVLRRVGLWNEIKDRLHRSALDLSGGQQQRLCIARALVLEPEILLLDEPCSALDPIASGVVEDVIQSLRNTTSLLIVTHNLAQARRISDWMAVCWYRDGAGYLEQVCSTQHAFEPTASPITRSYLGGIRG